jgi:hypothetical protein
MIRTHGNGIADRTKPSGSYQGKGANLKGLRVCVLGTVQGCLWLGASINGLGSWEGTRDLREGEEVYDGEACKGEFSCTCVSICEWGEQIREARAGLPGFCARWDWEWCSQLYGTARGYMQEGTGGRAGESVRDDGRQSIGVGKSVGRPKGNRQGE